METKYWGTYHKFGYEIWRNIGAGPEQVYQAGNCRYDSTQVLTPDNGHDTCTVDQLRGFCDSTGREMSEEGKGKWIGCSYDEDEEHDIEEALNHDNS